MENLSIYTEAPKRHNGSAVWRRTELSTADLSFILAFSLVNLVLFASNTTGYLAADLSFLMNLLYIVVLVSLLLASRVLSLFTSVFTVFFYTFFWLAPLLQTKAMRYPNTMGFNEGLVMKTNLLFLLFGLSFVLFRLILNRRRVCVLKRKNLNFWPGKRVFWIYGIVTVMLTLVFYQQLLGRLLYLEALLELQRTQALMITKFLFFFPVFLTYFVILDTRIIKGRKRWFMLIVALAIAFLFKNPANEYRNALGPIYLTLFLILFRKRFRSNLSYLLLLILVLTIIFPISGNLARGRIAITELPKATLDSIVGFTGLEVFRTLHYDSWSQTMATIEFVEIRGPTYGRQLLGSLLFFVPRSVWSDKPIGSGALLVREHLMFAYTLSFTNVSNSFVGEGYINFGLIGALLFSLILAILSIVSDRFQQYDDLRLIFAVYVSFHMVFMLRGDLMSSFSYLMGALAAIYFLPLFLSNLNLKGKITNR